jgi:tetratricopeptide (TPR) repeat protein
MITKDNILFGIVGLLVGLIVGFMFTNSINQSYGVSSPAMKQNSNLPQGHPDLQAGDSAAPGGGGSIPEVQAAIEKARSEPDNFDAQMKAAELYYQIQRFEGSIEFLTRANKIKPDDYGVTVQLGNANFDANKYSEAEKWYNTALAKKPEDVDVRTDLGLTFVFRDPPNYDRAIQEFKKVLEKDPNHIQTLQNLTVAYSKKGETENAKATLAKLEGVDPTNSALPQLRETIARPAN